MGNRRPFFFFLRPGIMAAVLLFSFENIPAQVTITVDGTAAGTPLKTVWSWYGYDECNYTTSQPSRELLDSVVAANLEQVYIRTHFLLNTGDGTPVLKWGSTNVYTENAGNPVYTWNLLDGIVDAIIGGRALPYMEIAFMPQALSTHPTPYQNTGTYVLDGGCFYPPTDYNKWAGLITAWAQHSLARYTGVEQNWIWELWNEPDIGYWHTTSGGQGTVAEYERLFDYTERALHTVLPNTVLGGPETASAGTFMSNFLTHCATGTNYATGATGTRVDLISFHAKGGTAVVSGHVRMDLGNQLRLHRSGFNIVAGFTQYRSKPIVVGEADPDGCAACPQNQYPADAYRNVAAYGAYEAAMMKHSLVLADSLGVNLRALLAWAWLFNGYPYFQGFRTLSSNNIHKPVLNVFKMLGKLKGNRIPLVSTGALGLGAILASGVRGANPDIDGMAVKSVGQVAALIWNYHDDIVQVAPATIQLRVTLPAAFPTQVRLTHYRMDTTHSNAYSTWLQMGSPQTPTAAQLAQLRASMALATLSAPSLVNAVAGVVSVNFDLPRHGVSLVVLDDPATVGVRRDNNDKIRTKFPAGRSSFLTVNEPGLHTVRIFDAAGRQIAVFRGNGPAAYSLKGLAKALGKTRLCLAAIATSQGISVRKILLF